MTAAPTASMRTKAQTLYTARFYETPSSTDTSGSSKQTGKAYLDRLFDIHAALQKVDEVPRSRPTTPDSERVESLEQQVKLAYKDANGNPASGKWGVLVNLLRTSSSRAKYKYIETQADVLPPEPGPEGWPELPATEEEWFAWEKKREESKALQAKVESWKQDIDVDASIHVNDPPRPPSKIKPRSITTIPETAYFPPSFPSHLETSTPLPANRRQPSPIVLAPSSSPLERYTSKRPPTPIAGPSKPVIHPPPPSPKDSLTKRQRSSSPIEQDDVPAKKARISSTSPSVSPASKKIAYRQPVTPPRPLPHLTDLLAASEKKRKLQDKGKAREKPISFASSKPKSFRRFKTTPPKLATHVEPVEASAEEMADNMINWEAAAEEQLALIPPVPSPTKSLSSIDGSNSIESQDSLPKYDPPNASTQPLSRLEAGSSLGTTERYRGFGQPQDFGFPIRYESQMDIESNMQGVDKLLDDDVGGYTGPWGEDDEQWDARADVPTSSP
ncbi:hypothetical protein MIND_00248400 [Mycena indigotica]|uniref:Uncharacterized protein n=1 Tax=Mycena indigotica TaxID=2126181 RepID=A0A8H6T788_9AGAR|nr:uncharacterized protein MIND_00248400 [Mycena indigotica]KAF7312353.1 hypothetical protein MIND_00248400 [Mycena indigotica]